MKYPKQFQKYILEICEKLRWEFFVNEYQLTIAYSESRTLDGEEVAATINTDLRYLTCKITIYPNLLDCWKKQDLKTINECLVHEFAHIITDPLYELAVKAVSKREEEFLDEVRERQTQRITNILFPHLKKLLTINKPSNARSNKSKRRRKRK